MPITVTLPADTKTPGTVGHTSDHNTIIDAITTIAAAAVNGSGDTVTLAAAAPGTPSAGTSVLYSSVATGTATVKLDSGLAGSLSPSQADLTTFTVTAAANTQFSKQWSIPANDASAGTVYRLTVWGSGTQGSTQQTFTPTPVLDSTVLVGGNRTTVPSTLIAISTSFNFRIIYELLILTTGAGGTALPSLTVEITQNTGSPTTAQTMALTAGPAASSSIDTTGARTMSCDLTWGSTTGAPTATSKFSLFERLGA